MGPRFLKAAAVLFAISAGGFACGARNDGDGATSTGAGGRPGAPDASYDEIKPLNLHDAAAVANCKAQSGHSVRTYVAWNGTAWWNEGIVAHVQFAELYGAQAELSPHYATWFAGYRTTFAPMI